MKSLLLTCLILISGQVFARDYVDSNNIKQLCESNGRLAGSVFRLKKAGGTLDGTLQSIGNKGNYDIIRRVFERDFADSVDANVDAYAKCMDEH